MTRFCDWCGEMIGVGETYYDIGDGEYCEDCAEFMDEDE